MTSGRPVDKRGGVGEDATAAAPTTSGPRSTTAAASVLAGREPASRLLVRRLACVGLLAIGLIAGAAGPALPGIREAFQVSLGQLGLLQVTGASGYMLAAFIAGILADRIGTRAVLLGGVLAVVGGIAWFTATGSWITAIVASTVFGCGVGVLDGVINTLVNEHSGDARGADLNLTHGFFGIGAVGAPMLGGVLLSIGLKWPAVYAAGFVATLATGVLAWRLRLDRAHLTREAPPSLAVLGTPVLGLLALILALYVGVELTVGNWAFTHLKTTYAAADAVAGAATALYWGGIMVGRFAMGTIGARISPHRLILANALVAAIALAAALLAPTLALAVVALAVLGVAIANIFPAVIAIAGEAYPHARGTVTGALIATGGIGGAIFPWLTGVVAERTGLGVALGGGVGLLLAILVAELGVLRLAR